MSVYNKRGVSAQKEEVHAATRHLGSGLFSYSFCKVFPDYLGGDDKMVNVMHADGAGTKSILAYLYWKETGQLDVWKGIAQDAIVMNLDDLLCVGIYDNIVFNSTIDRNKNLIPGEVLAAIIEGTQELFELLKRYGVHIHYLGGETADVGDVVRTVAVNGTMTARWPKTAVVTNQRIAPGDVIVGLASSGKATYENHYNSGIGSNGLTSARHDALSAHYARLYPESFDPALDKEVVYIGSHKLTDTWQPDYPIKGFSAITNYTVGDLLLSPTRTYAPLLKHLLEEYFDKIHGLVHCSGGGQTKCMKYLPAPLRIIKDNLFSIPPVFSMVQSGSGCSLREMYEVFNMGCRLEIYCKEAAAGLFIDAANRFGIDAQVIGRVEEAASSSLIIESGEQTISFSYPSKD